MKTITLVISSISLGALLFCFSAVASPHAKAINGPEMISPESSKKMTLVEGANYCRTLNSTCDVRVDGTPCSAEPLTDWHLPSSDELTRFLGLTTSENYLWTRTQFNELDKYIILSLLDGSWGWAGYAASLSVRCVR